MAAPLVAPAGGGRGVSSDVSPIGGAGRRAGGISPPTGAPVFAGRLIGKLIPAPLRPRLGPVADASSLKGSGGVLDNSAGTVGAPASGQKAAAFLPGSYTSASGGQ